MRKPKLKLTKAQQRIFELSKGKRTEYVDKPRADGKCGVCDGDVPKERPNQFYCSETCREAAYALTVERSYRESE